MLMPIKAQKFMSEKYFPTIVDKDGGLNGKMLIPNAEQIRKTSTQRSILRSQTSGVFTDLGDGMFLLTNAADPTSALLEVKVNAEQWSLLSSKDPFLMELMNISNRIYRKFNDDFDFIFFVLNTPYDNAIVSQLGFYGTNININNDVKGLGISLFNDAYWWGSSGKLKSAMYFPYYDAILSGPALHELCHNWAAYICPTYTPDNLRYDGHWGVSNAGGQLGGFKYVRTVETNSGGVQGKTLYQASFYSDETNPDGSFKYPGFGVNANGGNGLPYSDIELYLMGMKSAQKLRDENFHLDIYSGNDYNSNGDYSFGNGYFYSTTKTSYTIDDIIALDGARVPDATTSQKQFKVLTVALTPETAKEDYSEEIMQNVNWFAGAMNDNTYQGQLYNFRQATGNIGSLITDNIKNSLPKALLSNITISAGTLSPVFNPYILSYTIQVDASVETIDITGITDISGATVTGNVTALPLKLNDYTNVVISVTLLNGDSQTYKVFVIRGNIPDASLTWKIDNAEQKAKIMLDAVAGEKCVIDWGDGTAPDMFIGSGNAFNPIGWLVPEDSYVYSHTYNTPGTYKVTMYGEKSDNCPLTSLLWNQRNNQFDYRITSIDIRKAISLKSITLRNTEIANIDISHSPDLLYLYIENSLLTQLDVSKNNLLQYLVCIGSQLTSLNVSNNLLLNTLLCDNNQLSDINISKNKLLGNLSVTSNNLTRIDVSQNSALYSLDCGRNQLTNLDVSSNPALISLTCFNNKLTNLDISSNPLLWQLQCYNNQLTNIDVSNNPDLLYFHCEYNKLSNLDVSNNPVLSELYCNDNQLTNLDISHNPALTYLYCYANSISLANLYELSQKIKDTNNKFLGLQTLRDTTVVYNSSIPIDTVFHGVNTVFDVDASATDYRLNNGEITFLKPGRYWTRVSNSTITSSPKNPAFVQQTFYVTDNTRISNIPQTKPLNAWIQDGTLQVSGLTADKPWSVCNAAGAIVYQGIAAGDVETLRATSLPQPHGAYIIQSGKEAIKVIF